MNLPRISFSRPSFSLRFFIYSLFGLVLLALLIEGGYYFWQTKKGVRSVSREEIRAKLEEVRNDQNFSYGGGVFSKIIKDGQSDLLIVEQIENLENSVLTLRQDKERISVRISPNVQLKILDLKHGPRKFSGLDSLRENLAIGDKVGITEINFTEDDLPTTEAIIKIL